MDDVIKRKITIQIIIDDILIVFLVESLLEQMIAETQMVALLMAMLVVAQMATEVQVKLSQATNGETSQTNGGVEDISE